MKIYTFRVIIEPDENSTYHGYVPSLRGCHTWGESIEDTKANLREAIQCHVEGMLIDGESIPQESEMYQLIETFSDKDFSVKKIHKKEPLLAS
jgi:predicted RNase H-like HicB family nuclease